MAGRSPDLPAGWLSGAELVRLAQAEGLPVTRRTLRFYATLGLLPRPVTGTVSPRGRTGHFPAAALDSLRLLYRLKEQGYTLERISSLFRRLARQAGRTGLPATALHARVSRALPPDGTRGEGPAGAPGSPEQELWATVAPLVLGALVERGLEPGLEQVTGVDLQVRLEDGGELRLPVHRSLRLVGIRRAGPGDHPRLAELTAACWQEAPPPAEPLGRGRAGVEPLQVYLAEVEGTVIGYVGVGLAPERLARGRARLEGPYVEPPARRRGVGSRLLALAEARALAGGARWLTAAVTPGSAGAAFLERAGFRVTGSYCRVRGRVVAPGGAEQAPGGPLEVSEAASDALTLVGPALEAGYQGAALFRDALAAWEASRAPGGAGREPLRVWVARRDSRLAGLGVRVAEAGEGAVWLGAEGWPGGAGAELLRRVTAGGEDRPPSGWLFCDGPLERAWLEGAGFSVSGLGWCFGKRLEPQQERGVAK